MELGNFLEETIPKSSLDVCLGISQTRNSKREGTEASHNMACAENYRKSDINLGSIK